jgi:hypothetical protein
MLRPEQRNPAAPELLGSKGASGANVFDTQADNSSSWPIAPLPLHVSRLGAQPVLKTVRAANCAETANEYAAEPRFKRTLAKLHALELQPLAELLGDLGTNTMQTTWIEAMVWRYARVDPPMVQALDRAQCPRLPFQEVGR